MTVTEANDASEAIFRNDIPYLALTGKLWGVFCEDLGENWPNYNGTVLYMAYSLSSVWQWP